jgi:hypothetical protein
MRVVISLALLIGGIGLILLDTLAHAFANAPAMSYYRKQLQSFPVKKTYSRAELADAAWQVWTNRVALPDQSTYTVADLKAAIVSPLLGTQQDYCDRIMFEHAIGRVMGYRERSDNGMAVIGFLAVFFGTLSLGGILYPARRKAPPLNKPI